ncbi:unnamed protein product [Schistocephalus solidus]|uniref:Uncharacterized protein n=1 Tax=Schistocephalus solidus TaxID=70667 RepID=A0A183SWW8_SCHSO|nr:unnamed protein product [Schistocephalus solidus]
MNSTASLLTEEGARKGSLNSRPRLADHKIHRRKTQTTYQPPNTPRDARVSPLTIAAMNVRSLLNNPRSNRPERRMALVARELARYKVEIAALKESRFSDQGQLEEMGGSYTFFRSGRPKA